MSRYLRGIANILSHRRLGVVLLLPILALSVGVAASFWLEEPAYEASAELTVSPPEAVWAIAEAVPTIPVARGTLERLDLSGTDPITLLENLHAEHIFKNENPQVVRVSYRDANPQRAQKVVNAASIVASEKVSGALFSDNSDVRVRVWKTATIPHTPVAPSSLVRNSLVGLGIGLLLGVGSALLMERRGSSA